MSDVSRPRASQFAAALAIGALVLTSACASPRPKLYPNAKLQAAGAEAAEMDIDGCLALADSADLENSKAADAAKSTAVGGAVRGASGAAAGAVMGNAGRGAGAGAAAGAVVGLAGSLLKANEPDALYKNYVNLCLAEHGYQTIGWK